MKNPWQKKNYIPYQCVNLKKCLYKIVGTFELGHILNKTLFITICVYYNNIVFMCNMADASTLTFERAEYSCNKNDVNLKICIL
jgi:hypothetical protein